MSNLLVMKRSSDSNYDLQFLKLKKEQNFKVKSNSCSFYVVWQTQYLSDYETKCSIVCSNTVCDIKEVVLRYL